MAIISGDFRTHGHNIAQIERLNAELTRGHNRRAPARSFPNTAAASVLRQAASVVHRNRGGENPLAPKALMKQQPQEELVCSPLLLPLVGGITEAGAPTAASMAALADGGVAKGVAAAALQSPAAEGHDHAVVAAPGGLCANGSFGGPVAILRDNPSLLGVPHAADEARRDARKRGLNPYILEKNKHMAAARQALGRPMTPEEQRRATADFKELWSSMDQDVFKEAYAEWRSASSTDHEAHHLQPYKPSWGGGCSATLVSKMEMHKYVVDHGWPSDKDLQKRVMDYKVPLCEVTDFGATSGFDLFGIGRWPRNVDRSTVNAQQFDLCDRGIFNVLEQRLGKQAADSGEVMLIVSGPSLVLSGRTERCVCLVSGTCYSPKVWGTNWLEFEDEALSTSAELNLPCWVRIGVRRCLVANASEAIDLRTSDEFIKALTSQMAWMTIHIARYEVAPKEGGLFWSRIDSIEARLCCPTAGVVVRKGTHRT